MTKDEGGPKTGTRRRELLDQGRSLADFVESSPEARAFFDDWDEPSSADGKSPPPRKGGRSGR